MKQNKPKISEWKSDNAKIIHTNRFHYWKAIWNKVCQPNNNFLQAVNYNFQFHIDHFSSWSPIQVSLWETVVERLYIKISQNSKIYRISKVHSLSTVEHGTVKWVFHSNSMKMSLEKVMSIWNSIGIGSWSKLSQSLPLASISWTFHKDLLVDLTMEETLL
jgi:hypothetical protein